MKTIHHRLLSKGMRWMARSIVAALFPNAEPPMIPGRGHSVLDAGYWMRAHLQRQDRMAAEQVKSEPQLS